MEFRWIVFLTLWTAFSGPVLARPGWFLHSENATAKVAPEKPRSKSQMQNRWTAEDLGKTRKETQ